MISDVEMQVPLRHVLKGRATGGTGRTYAYFFTWEAPERGCVLHAVDIPFTFDTFDVDGWGEFVGVDVDADAARSGAPQRVGGVPPATGIRGGAEYPATHVFGRTSYDAAAHPLFARQQDYWPG